MNKAAGITAGGTYSAYKPPPMTTAGGSGAIAASLLGVASEKRNAVAARYSQALAPHVRSVPKVIEGGFSNWAQYTIEHDNRDALAAHRPVVAAVAGGGGSDDPPPPPPPPVSL